MILGLLMILTQNRFCGKRRKRKGGKMIRGKKETRSS
jgi:hypothetical protein